MVVELAVRGFNPATSPTKESICVAWSSSSGVFVAVELKQQSRRRHAANGFASPTDGATD
jgi:hypothetical protein